jgi:hypothetical protein
VEIMSALHQQNGGFSLETYSGMTGVSIDRLRRYAVAGRIIGARKHPLTKKWWIYPPATLMKGRLL